MKSYIRQSCMRLAVVALSVIQPIIAFLWALEIKRLIWRVKRMGWSVQFAPDLGDALGAITGVTLHRDKVIKILSGLSPERTAEVLLHEIEHAGGKVNARCSAWLRCGGTWCDKAGFIAAAYETVAGAKLFCTTTAPATYDLAGYSASEIVWTEIGEITDLPGASGRNYNTVEHAPLSSRRRQRKKGSYTLDDIVVQMAWDQDDAGQNLCRTASEDDSVLTFMLTKQGGDNRYFTAQVAGFVEQMGTVDNVVIGQMTLLRQTDTVNDPA